VRRADRVPMPALAIDVLPPVFLHGVIARQEDRAGGQQVVEGPAGQEPGQPPARPAPLREDAAVAGGGAGDERPGGAQEGGGGVPADGQQGRRGPEAEGQGGGAVEGAAQGIDEGAGGTRPPVVQLAELSSDGPRLAGLVPTPSASLGLGQAPPPAYAGHHSLLVRDTGRV